MGNDKYAFLLLLSKLAIFSRGGGSGPPVPVSIWEFPSNLGYIWIFTQSRILVCGTCAAGPWLLFFSIALVG